jgi:hypothetical protein
VLLLYNGPIFKESLFVYIIGAEVLYFKNKFPVLNIILLDYFRLFYILSFDILKYGETFYND